MDNNYFLNKLLAGTKSGKLNWETATTKPGSDIIYNDFDAYFVKRKDKFIVLQKYTQFEYSSGDEYNVVKYMISVCDSKFKREYDMYEDDFENDGVGLIRLYRLAERKAKKIDNLLDNLVSDIDDFLF
jgi:hypothetical protein